MGDTSNTLWSLCLFKPRKFGLFMGNSNFFPCTKISEHGRNTGKFKINCLSECDFNIFLNYTIDDDNEYEKKLPASKRVGTIK